MKNAHDIIIFILMGAFACMMYRRSEKYARGVVYDLEDNGSVGPKTYCDGEPLEDTRGEWTKPQTLEKCKETCAYNDSCVGFNTKTCPGKECEEETNICNFQGMGCKVKRTTKDKSWWYPVSSSSQKRERGCTVTRCTLPDTLAVQSVSKAKKEKKKKIANTMVMQDGNNIEFS